MLCEQRSRQYEEETSVILKTEELRGGQETQRDRGEDNLYKNGQSAKSLEQENSLEVVPDTNQGF